MGNPSKNRFYQYQYFGVIFHCSFANVIVGVDWVKGARNL